MNSIHFIFHLNPFPSIWINDKIFLPLHRFQNISRSLTNFSIFCVSSTKHSYKWSSYINGRSYKILPNFFHTFEKFPRVNFKIIAFEHVLLWGKARLFLTFTSPFTIHIVLFQNGAIIIYSFQAEFDTELEGKCLEIESSENLHLS